MYIYLCNIQGAKEGQDITNLMEVLRYLYDQNKDKEWFILVPEGSHIFIKVIFKPIIKELNLSVGSLCAYKESLFWGT
jgi:hypothetical protein